MALPVNIELGIAEILRAVDEIFGRKRDRLEKEQAEAIAKLHQELEVIFTVITKLEDLFIEVLQGFKNEDILKNPDALKAHIDQTQIFLDSKKVLPILQGTIGGVGGAIVNPNFQGKKYKKLIEALTDLNRKLDIFYGALGRGETAPGLYHLQTLRDLAKQQIAVDYPEYKVNPEIAGIAMNAFEEYDWELTSEIRRLIGYVKMLS